MKIWECFKNKRKWFKNKRGDDIISPDMRRTNIKKILKLVKKFYNNILPQLPQKSTSKGRPKKYPDALILSLAVLKELFVLS
ncbi:hypothetical protein XO09_05220, partial [Thermosipho sp. 1223]